MMPPMPVLVALVSAGAGSEPRKMVCTIGSTAVMTIPSSVWRMPVTLSSMPVRPVVPPARWMPR